MELRTWCNSGTQRLTLSPAYAKRRRNQMLSINMFVIRSKLGLYWRMLWGKLMREKKVLDSSSSARRNVSYDPYTYAQNFDQGLMFAADPDDLARCFSARFAVPSRLFEKTERMVCL
ncbi:hypothetical protein F3Y22_tig00112215pilonHSYRG00310 [Hibiscus syriacus]|uniref:Uncharacterized protein n=1 Tax=Hibiscus syriacus TaxID=106335 RepID=A0A6A2X4G5_HIBSY|nr:hypothetical protein F3Y22_tig00112215pilonHSYRG00310 [Hibiscus syriacus]